MSSPLHPWKASLHCSLLESSAHVKRFYRLYAYALEGRGYGELPALSWGCGPVLGGWKGVGICMSSTIVVTDYHQLSGLKQHKHVITQFCEPKSDTGLTELKSRCWQNCAPSRRLSVKRYFLAFSHLGTTPISLSSGDPYSFFKARNIASS